MMPSLDLLKELEEHNDFFDDLVNMIPAKLYIAGNSGDDKYVPSKKYYKGHHKESKEARKARNKAAKRAKFDPDLSETTTQTKQRWTQQFEDDDEAEQSKPKTPKKVIINGDSEEIQREMMKKKKSNKTPVDENNNNNTPSSDSKELQYSSRIEALRAKLRAKIAEKQSRRPEQGNDQQQQISKRAARRAEKQRRQEEAKQKKKKKTTATASQSTKQQQQYSVQNKNSGASNITPSMDLQSMDFGKLAGLNTASKNYKNNRSLSNIHKPKNLEKLLKDAEEKREKLRALQQRGGTEKEREQNRVEASKVLWKDAMKEASGERVRDDPAKLRKALKKKVAQKTKSQKAWKSRMEQVADQAKERQAIRKHNLEKRKLGGASGANLSRKRIVEEDGEPDGDSKKKKKRRQSRAGFEGRKQEFLNSKKD